MSYDRSITVFSPDGHLLQVEYAMEAVRKGAAVVGVRTRDAVILAVEKRAAAKLQDDRTLGKILRVDQNIALAFAGLNADARVLVNKTRIEAQSHRLTVEDAPTVEYIARFIGTTQQRYTQRGGVRPFGLALLVAGMSADGKPQLWSTDPSGVYSAWKANAVGRNSKSLLELLEKNYPVPAPGTVAPGGDTSCTLEQGQKLAVTALLEVVESGAKSIEMAIIRAGKPMEMVSEADLAALVARVEAEKAAEAAEAAGETPAGTTTAAASSSSATGSS